MSEGKEKHDSPGRPPPSQAVVEAVADAEGVEPEGLGPPEYEPLNEVVDPGALDDLFAPKVNGFERVSGEVRFRYCGYEVTVRRDGSVDLE